MDASVPNRDAQQSKTQETKCEFDVPLLEELGLEDLQPNGFRKLFSLWDADESGYLDMDEVIEGVKGLYQSQDLALFDESTIQRAFHSVDEDHNEVLDRYEFQSLLDEVAEHLGIKKEDLMTIANASEEDMSSPKTFHHHSASALFPKRNLLGAILRTMKTYRKNCIDASKSRQKKIEESLRQTVSKLNSRSCSDLSRGVSMRNNKSSRMQSLRDFKDEDSDGFLDELDSEDKNAMWIQMEELSLPSRVLLSDSVTNPAA